MTALLHDGGTFTIVLADDHQRAAGHPAGRQVGERVGRHVGADRRLEGHGTAQRIIDRRRQRRGGGRLVGARFEVDAELLQDVVRVRQHVHQVRDRRALVASDVGHAGLQQRLGDGEDALAVEFLTGAELELPHFLFE